MKRKAFLQTACALTAALLLLAAGCTRDDFSSGQGEPLPEGKYPMIFATTVEGVTATRAATADGQWTTGDEIAMQVGSEKRYTPTNISSNSATVTLSSTSPFYWQDTNDVSVSAWYCGTGYNATMLETWSVQSDQNSNDGYQKSDFLYVPQTAIL